MKDSKIGWTDHTFNPWQGCEHVSPACDHCYAETLSKRVGHPERWGPGSLREPTGPGYWRNPHKWNAAAATAGRPALVFCGSMCDVFEDRVDLEDPRARLFDLIDATRHLVWMLLTKRPENIAWMVPPAWLRPRPYGELLSGWPANVWVGTTVEDQARADERIPVLLDLPAPVRFLSCEPLLGPIDLVPYVARVETDQGVRYPSEIGWLIVGGESGPGHRRLDLEAVHELERIADLAEIPFFFKQHGGATTAAGGHLLDGRLRYAWPELAGDRSDLIAEAERAAIEAETDVEIR